MKRTICYPQQGISRLTVVVLGALLVSLFPTSSAFATGGYEAKVNKSEVSVTMSEGGWRTIILTYTNTGSKTWKRDGAGYVSTYLLNKKSTPIAGPEWRTSESPAKIADSSVAPGKQTTVSFRVYGNKQGTYTETFRLASEDTAWMKGSETVVKVTVTPPLGGTSATPAATAPAAPATPVAETTVAPPASTSGSSALLLLRSARELKMRGSERVQVTLGFKNTGAGTWATRSLLLAGMTPAMSDINSSVRDTSWRSEAEPVREESPTKPGEIGFLTFWVKAPAKQGSYTASFQLQADGQAVEGGLIDIPVTVTADGVFIADPSITPPASSGTAVDPNVITQSSVFYSEEPILRVGLFATTDDQMIVSAPAAFRVMDKDGVEVCAFTANQEVTVRYDRVNGVYRALGPGCTSQSSTHYRVQRTDDPLAPLTMTDFNRPVSWLPGANDNTFRSILELRHSVKTGDVWVINELPIEMYLRGLAETSDVSPIEYQKALLTAARTYAMYHWTRGTKHAAEHFHVDAKYDQVYRGYGAEARSPKIVQGVTDTRGQIVTFNGTLAITPYFSRSDGRTRNWNEVWGGSGYAWLVGVQVPHDVGQTLWGHGVGLSARGALYMASKDNATYRQILSHFYQGTNVMYFY